MTGWCRWGITARAMGELGRRRGIWLGRNLWVSLGRRALRPRAASETGRLSRALRISVVSRTAGDRRAYRYKGVGAKSCPPPHPDLGDALVSSYSAGWKDHRFKKQASELLRCRPKSPRNPDDAKTPAVCLKLLSGQYECGHTAGVDEIELAQVDDGLERT